MTENCANPYLQFGGGSSVISANSFWILFADVESAFDPNAFELLFELLDLSRSEAAVAEELEADILAFQSWSINLTSFFSSKLKTTPENGWRWINHSWYQSYFTSTDFLTQKNLCKPKVLLMITSRPEHPVKFQDWNLRMLKNYLFLRNLVLGKWYRLFLAQTTKPFTTATKLNGVFFATAMEQSPGRWSQSRFVWY